MDRYGGPKTALTIALLGGLYLAIMMDRYGGKTTALTIALPGALYSAIIMVRYRGPYNCHYYCLAWKPLLSHYNGPVWRAQNCPYYIALPGGLYLAIIMDRYRGPQTGLNIALSGGLY
jgi:hypothetical protein